MKKPDGKTITLWVEASNTINMVKSQLQGETGIPRQEQRLMFVGMDLEGHRDLDDYGIQRESTIDLVPCLRFAVLCFCVYDLLFMICFLLVAFYDLLFMILV